MRISCALVSWIPYSGDSRAAWDALQFRTPGINSGFGPLAIEQGHRFDPQQNPDVRIAYLYRNPLDQAVSHYRHLFWLEKQIQPVAFRAGLNDWMRKDAIESYLKQYFSYYAMTQSHPSNVIRICYEDLFRTPAAVFKRLAQFFDFTIQTDGELKAFLRALWATTPQAMRMLERKQGHAFGDSNAKNDSHLHGGEVGNGDAGWTTRPGNTHKSIRGSRIVSSGFRHDLKPYLCGIRPQLRLPAAHLQPAASPIVVWRVGRVRSLRMSSMCTCTMIACGR